MNFTFASRLHVDDALVLLQLGLRHVIEGVLGVHRLVDGSVMLEVALNDALGGRADLIVDVIGRRERPRGPRAVRPILPRGRTLEDFGLGSGGNSSGSSAFLHGRLDALEFLFGGTQRYKLVRTLHLDGRRLGRRTVGNPLKREREKKSVLKHEHVINKS